jgi:hypothetical protein
MKSIIDENEVKRILMMHKVLKEQETPTETPVTPTSTAPKPENEYKKLKEAESVKCLFNGAIYKNHPKKKTYFYRGVSQKSKKEIDFFGDMTYEFVDGSKSGTWTCSRFKDSSYSDDFQSSVSLQTPEKNKCRDKINRFYDSWENKVDIDDTTFNRVKQEVQTCVNHYEEDWGGLLNLGPLKKKVDLLKGAKGGTSSWGRDSKWRLN